MVLATSSRWALPSMLGTRFVASNSAMYGITHVSQEAIDWSSHRRPLLLRTTLIEAAVRARRSRSGPPPAIAALAGARSAAGCRDHSLPASRRPDWAPTAGA